jgi:hypothetical protein
MKFFGGRARRDSSRSAADLSDVTDPDIAAPADGIGKTETSSGGDLAEALSVIHRLVPKTQFPKLQFPSAETVKEVKIENFASPTYQRVGFDQRSDFLPADRHVYTVRHGEADETLVVVSGKAASENPYAIAYSGFGRGDVDLRPIMTTVYASDGAGTIREHTSNGAVREYTGKNGNLGVLLGYVYQSMGTLVDEVTIQNTQIEKSSTERPRSGGAHEGF